MKAICPTNPKHKTFITTAHVQQEWKVDEHGEFIEVVHECLDTTHGPDIGNTWSCTECFAEAIVTD